MSSDTLKNSNQISETSNNIPKNTNTQLFTTIYCRKEKMTNIYKNYKSIPVTILYVYPFEIIKNINNNKTQILVKVKTNMKYPQKQELKINNLIDDSKKKYQGKIKTVDLIKSTNINDLLVLGEKLKVTSRSKGHGYTGVIKRHNFKGQRASHGTSLTHRSLGSTGTRDLGKTYKGRKMAGRHGYKKTTIHGLELLNIIKSESHTIIAVKGSIPGANGSLVAVKRII